MHLLPLSLGRLAEHTDRPAVIGRYAAGCVLLRVNPDNTFEAVATDTKVLVRVTGPCVAAPGDFPDFPEFAAKPDGATAALIPADAWRHAFTWGRKLTAKARTSTVPLKCVAVRIGETETAFAAANEYHSWCESVENVIGRYPPYQDILAAVEAEPRDRFGVDPRLFGELLRTAAELQPDASRAEVVVSTNGPRKPVGVRFGNAGGLEFAGVVMPLDLGLTSPQDVTSLGRRCAELLAERDELVKRVGELTAALATARTPNVRGTE